MATLRFFLRKSQSHQNNTTEGKVCARVIHQRKLRTLTLEVSLYEHEWDEQKQAVIPGRKGSRRYPYLKEAAGILKSYREEFLEVVGQLEERGAYDVYDIYMGSQSRRDISTLHSFTTYLSHKLDKAGQKRTARAYRSACHAFIAFYKSNIPLKHISPSLIEEFEAHLKERDIALNTISYYMRMLRAIYNKAIREKLIEGRSDNPFEKVYTGIRQAQGHALDIEELRMLRNLDFAIMLEAGHPVETTGDNSGKELYDCWRYFFFCFYARGMSFVDMCYLRKEDIRDGVISYDYKRTGRKVELPLIPILKDIIDSFSEEVGHSPYVFPVITDADKPSYAQYEAGLRTQNIRLKSLAAKANLPSHPGLSTYTARHSWEAAMEYMATNILSAGYLITKEEKTKG